MGGTSESEELYLYSQEDHRYQSGIQEYSFIMIKFTCWLSMRASLLYMMLPSWSACAIGLFMIPISSAIYSCDRVLVYASFRKLLRPHCRIAPSAYLPSGMNSINAYSLVVASHPSEPMTDGGVHVIVPSESEGKWDVGPPPDNGTIGSNPTLCNQGSDLTLSNQGSEPPSRYFNVRT